MSSGDKESLMPSIADDKPKTMTVNEALAALGTPLRLPNFAPTEAEAEFSWNNDVPMTLLGWQRFIHQWAETKGWNQDLEERSFGDWCALFHTEISEAYEDHRNHHSLRGIYYQDHEGISVPVEQEANLLARGHNLKPCGIPIEMADLAIRLLHFCEFAGIDLNEMIALKMKYNETRAFRHGGKKV